MSSDFNLTGSWVGEYRQSDRPHPIAAEFLQAGEALSGSMRDGEPDQELSVSEVASEAGDAPGADERIVASLRKMFPDSTGAPIRYVSHLPPESTLEGWVRGPGVYFVKSYRGTSFGGFRVGDRVIGQESENAVVHYSGRVGPGGGEIEGRWSIAPTPEAGGRRFEGSFILRRRDDARAAASDPSPVAPPTPEVAQE